MFCQVWELCRKDSSSWSPRIWLTNTAGFRWFSTMACGSASGCSDTMVLTGDKQFARPSEPIKGEKPGYHTAWYSGFWKGKEKMKLKKEKCRHQLFDYEADYVICPTCGEPIAENIPNNPNFKLQMIRRSRKYKRFLRWKTGYFFFLFLILFLMLFIIFN